MTKSDIAGYVSDLFSDFLYYDRKEDDEFTVEDAGNISSIISKDDLIEVFTNEIEKLYSTCIGGSI